MSKLRAFLIGLIQGIWNPIKGPVFIISIFFLAGLGFSLGVTYSDGYRALMNDTAIVITTIKLNKE